MTDNDFIFTDVRTRPFRLRREVAVLSLYCWNPQDKQWAFVRQIANDDPRIKSWLNQKLPDKSAAEYEGGIPFLTE